MMLYARKAATYNDGREAGSVASARRDPWYRGGINPGRRRRYAFAGASKRFNLNDSVNSPGFPGSSTYYFNGIGDADPLSVAIDTATANSGSASGTNTGGSIWDTIASNVSKITTTAIPAYMQYKVWNENLKRARQGLAPLDPNTYAPAARVQVDAGPNIRAAAKTAGFGVGGLALVGVGLWLLLRRR